MKFKRYFTRLHFLLQLLIITQLIFIACSQSDSVLIESIKSGDISKTEELLKALDEDAVNKTGHGGTPPIIYAVRMDRIDLVELLVRYGADVNLEEMSSGGTPLMIAVLKQQVEIVNLLVRSGANVNYRDLLENKTIMDVASEMKQSNSNKKTQAIFEYLRSNNAKTSDELPSVSNFETFIMWNYLYLKPVLPYLIAVFLIAILLSFIFPNNFINRMMRKRITFFKHKTDRDYDKNDK